MKKSTLLSIALICLSTTSYATQPTSDGTVCNGSGSCGSTTTNTTTNQGGTGIGQGGSASSVATGGSSTAFGGAGGIAYNGGNTSVNANTVKNESTNIQGQQQGQTQAIKNSGNSSSTSSANNSGNNTGNSAASNSVTVQGDNFESARNPVNTAYAPSIAPSANCSLGISGGVSFVGFSGSFGKAYTDKDCVANEDIRNVAIVLGDKATAEEMKCISSPAYRKARAALNRPCAVEQE